MYSYENKYYLYNYIVQNAIQLICEVIEKQKQPLKKQTNGNKVYK